MQNYACFYLKYLKYPITQMNSIERTAYARYFDFSSSPSLIYFAYNLDLLFWALQFNKFGRQPKSFVIFSNDREIIEIRRTPATRMQILLHASRTN